MCEQTEINYLDGEVVWVKLGSCWWPGEVVATDKLPPDVLPSFKKPPIAVVKFFEEDSYEYVKNINSIYKYNCSRKNEFINKGLYMYRTKHGHMEKFPEDVIRAETAVGGDIEILTRDEFQEPKKESYAGLFGDPAKRTPNSIKKGKGKGRPTQESPQIFHPVRKMKEKTDYKVHILVQGSKTPSTSSTEVANSSELTATPSTSTTEPTGIVEEKDDKETTLQNDNKPISSAPTPTPSTPSSGTNVYPCHSCPFTTTRLNVIIMHNKTHSVTFVPYTPSPVRKKPVSKPTPKSTSNSMKTPKPRKPRAEKTEKPKKVSAKKRSSDEKLTNVEVKKPKTDEEIKSSLLADWDDGDEDSNDGSNVASSRSPEVPVGAESPAVPTSAELPTAQTPDDIPLVAKKQVDCSPSSEKPESSSDSKYEFCEDEDWPVEADAGRKIPRVKNPKRTDETTKSLSIDDDEMAREVAELLNKTAVPELPSVPEPLKVEENFPEPSIVKSPDKMREVTPEKTVDKPPEQQPTKAIFKTKTFFRSRHSRSQDAIGKYVAEQLNAVERMDIAECDINGSEAVSSPDARDSPPIEPVKVTRLAPKIQLKKMKLEAAQQREKEKSNYDQSTDLYDMGYMPDVAVSDSSSIPESPLVDDTRPKDGDNTSLKSADDMPYLSEEVNSLDNANEININSEGKTEIEKQINETAKLNNSNAETNTNKVTPEENEVSNEINVNSENKIDEMPVVEFPEPVLPSNEVINEEKVIENTNNAYLNESTASAVDALLSVSREADRVTKIISNDPPENLFEDDNTTGEQEYELTINTNIESHDKDVDSNFYKEKDHFPPAIPDIVDTNNSNSVHSEITFDHSQTNDAVVMKDVQITSECNSQPSKDDELHAENVPSESDLQIAETLISLPSTAVQSKTSSKSIHKLSTAMLFESEESSQEGMSVVNPTEKMENSNSQDSRDVLTPLSNHEEIEVASQEEIAIDNPPDILSINVIPTSGQEEIISTSSQEEIISTSSQEEIIPMNECVEETVIDEKEQLIESKTFEEPQFVPNNDSIKNRFETEQEKCENLNAAQSLVQMSECVDHKVNIMDAVEGEKVIESNAFNIRSNNGIDNKNNSLEQNLDDGLNEMSSKVEASKTKIFETPSKLLKILEDPCKPRIIHSKSNIHKPIIMQGKEKILNFDVAKSTFKSKPQGQSPKQKIIIRRTAPTNKTVINNVGDRTSHDKIILSRSSNLTQDGSSVQTYTIQTTPDPPSDANTIIIQQKRNIAKPQSKLQKVKPQPTLVTPVTEIIKPVTETVTTDDAMFDINSMPIVLSDDLLTPESIEKMPVVMSDANIITHTNQTKINKPKLTIIENEKISVTSSVPKPELRKLLLNPVTEVNKSSSPNILSKSSKLRGPKPMLVIDRTTGKQKIIMTKSEPIIKEVKQTPTIIQTPQLVPASKSEKFIILPTQNQPRPNRTQKIVIDPQTGKAHVIVAKGNDPPLTAAENKPVSAKLVPSNSDASAPGNTVMIITNAQGAQSRIVLTPEHEKILFPNKQQPNVSQLKTIAHRITTNSPVPKKLVTTMAPVRATSNIAPARPPARIVPKQKSAIITSKGQLIVGGRVATTAQNIAPMPEIRPVPRPRVTNEPKKIIQTVQKTNSEPMIFLQQKSGAVMQLTTAQFEHLQRTGQIVKKTTTVPVQERVVIQKNKISSESGTNSKSRIRKAATEAPTPPKKIKPQEIPIAPAPAPAPALVAAPAPAPVVTTLIPALSTVIQAPVAVAAAAPHVAAVAGSSSYSEFDNFEELLPSTAIVRQVEPAAPPPLPPPPAAPEPPPAAALSDGQLLAVPGEHFGGPAGTFYLCLEDSGTFTPIDNRPLVLENNQLVPMEAVEAAPAPAPQPERRDILEAALANSDVFHADGRDEAPDFRDLNANVSVHCRVSETSTTLHQPIMTPVEMPSKADCEGAAAVPSSLEAGLAVIGVTPHSVPTSLELPITVTDPRIAPRPSDPLSAYPPDAVMSMPLLAEEEAVGKSMPILTDDVAERAASSVDSMGEGSPASLEDSAQWTRRLLTPCEDMSDASVEIPLQPSLHLTVNDLSSQT